VVTGLLERPGNGYHPDEVGLDLEEADILLGARTEGDLTLDPDVIAGQRV
jgi:hypothetical protein